MDAKAQLAAAQPCASAFYGLEVAEMNNDLQQRMERAVVSAVWGDSRQSSCKEVVLTVLMRGHLVDPLQAAVYRRLTAWWRMMRSHPELHSLVDNLRTKLGRATGPVSLVLAALKWLGWAWRSQWRISLGVGREEVNLLTVDKGKWLHLVREACRMKLWAIAAGRRQSMIGIERGLDRDASRAILEDSSRTWLMRGFGRTVIAGAVWPRPRCRHCEVDGEPPEETKEHLFWVCPRWDDVRRRHTDVMRQDRTGWPNCLKQCGLVPLDLLPSAAKRKELALKVQRMMVDILMAQVRTGEGQLWHSSSPIDGVPLRLGSGRLRAALRRAVWQEDDGAKDLEAVGPQLRQLSGHCELPRELELAAGPILAPATRYHFLGVGNRLRASHGPSAGERQCHTS